MKLGYEQSSLYPALFYLIKEGQLYRVVASHIDVFWLDENFHRPWKHLDRILYLAGELEVSDITCVNFSAGKTAQKEKCSSCINTMFIKLEMTYHYEHFDEITKTWTTINLAIFLISLLLTQRDIS